MIRRKVLIQCVIYCVCVCVWLYIILFQIKKKKKKKKKKSSRVIYKLCACKDWVDVIQWQVGKLI
jgi:hypothetical protein